MIISDRVKAVFGREDWILGREVEELEQRVAAYTRRKHAVACGSGADALYLALDAAGISEWSNVITTPFTFGATAAAITRTGARLIFADIGPDLQIDPEHVERICRSSGRIDAVVAVDLFGGMPRYLELAEICRKYNAVLIEDAAQAFGAEYDGKLAGALGEIGAFSFHPSKPLGAMGDAGMVVFDGSTAAADMIRRRRNHGQESKYRYTEAGLNSRLDTIQAAAILDKLDGYEAELARRRRSALSYREAIRSVRHPIKAGGTQNPSFSIYPVQFDLQEQRDEAMAKLLAEGIWCRVYYPSPLHLEPAFSFLGYSRGDLPWAERACRTVLALPMEGEPDVGRIAEIIGGVAEK